MIEKLNQWPFFDRELPRDDDYVFWHHHTIREICRKLEFDGHTRSSFNYVIRFMLSIGKKGWSDTVREHLEKNIEQLGVLNRAHELI